MATVTFILKKPKSKDKTLIYAIFWIGNQRIKLSTGERIDPGLWDDKKNRARKSRKLFKGYPEFNKRLDDITSDLLDEHRRMVNDDVPVTIPVLRESLKSLITKKNKTPSFTIDFFQFVESFIEKCNRTTNTKKGYTTTLNHLNDFQKVYPRKIDFNTIDLDFYNSFVSYFKSDGYRINTIGKNIKNVKVFLNEAQDRGIKINPEVWNRRFKTVEEETQAIYLNEKELQAIYDLDLSSKPKLDRVRDLFIMGCYTGLRFSDLANLRPVNFIDDGKKVRIKTEKTGQIVELPVHDKIKEILQKYDGDLPKVLSNQKMNDYLKDLGEEAKLDNDIQIPINKRNLKRKNTAKKYELITTHTARRSFASNAYLADVPVISIMKITGHKTERSFMKYIKISQEENADKLVDHPFFKQKEEHS